VNARYSYPHTIENGAGERVTFVRRVAGPRGERLEVENVVQPGSGPPMHTHRHQTEALTVQAGRIGYQRPDGDPEFAGPGKTVTFAAGEPHRFWNAGEGELRCTGWIEPPDNIEYFLTEFYASARRSGGGRPDPFDAAFLVHHFRSEFALHAVPAVVQLVIFPLQVLLGRMLGRYARYADAPSPIP